MIAFPITLIEARRAKRSLERESNVDAKIIGNRGRYWIEVTRLEQSGRKLANRIPAEFTERLGRPLGRRNRG